MSLFANRRIRIRPGVCTLVKRKLKGPGQILVQRNVEVSPGDVIGRYKQTLGFTKINIASELNISPAEVPKTLYKAIGQTVFKGEVLASKKGMFNKETLLPRFISLGNKHQILAPTDGIFQSIDARTGEATLKLLPRDISLTAGVFGVIQNVDGQKGEISIQTMVSEIYGVYGTGEEREGFINIIADAHELLNKDKISLESRGQILVTGSLMIEAAIKKAINCAVRGIICGGVNMDDYRAMTGSLAPQSRVDIDIGIGIVGTEGFGAIPIGEDIFNLLKEYNGKFALIQGNFGRILLPSTDPNSILSCRKVRLPADPLSEKPPLTVEEIRMGLRVRLIAAPFMGSQGDVISIDGSPTKLESGIVTYLITVKTKNKQIKTAYSNVELI